MTGAEKQSQKEVKKTNLLNFGNAFETFTDFSIFFIKKKIFKFKHTNRAQLRLKIN